MLTLRPCRWWIRFCLILLCLAGPLGASPTPQAQSPGLVIAFYYAWFDLNTWSSGTTSDQPLAPYVSAERATIERHVAQAQAAGIDALAQAWYGPSGEFNQTEPNLQTLLDVSAGRGLRVSVQFETYSPYLPADADVVNALSHLLDVHAAHPAYLRLDGRPVIFFWAQGRYSPSQWAAIREQVDPNRASIWMAEGAAEAYLGAFDGLYLYNVAWSFNLAGTAAKWAGVVRQASQTYGVYKYWAGTAMPGWNDTLVPGRQGSFVREREGGAFYGQTWQAAIDSQPDMVVITSFNEWPEGSMIEPSQSYGNTYLELSAQYAAQYKRAAASGWPQPPTATPDAASPSPPTPVVTATSGPPSATPTAPPSPTATLTPSAVGTSQASPTPAPTGVPAAPMGQGRSTARPSLSPTASPSPPPSPSPSLWSPPAESIAQAHVQAPTPPPTAPPVPPGGSGRPSLFRWVLAGSPTKLALSGVLAALLIVILWHNQRAKGER